MNAYRLLVVARPLLVLLLAGCAATTSAPAPAAPGAAMGPPATDIYLAELTWEAGAMRLGEPVNLTDREGYDNQPSFTPDGAALLYTSIREDGQADVYRYDLAAGTGARLTRTSESEYSPTVTPDGAGISVVRVEADSTQRLWRFELDGTRPQLLLEQVLSVGYHAWIDERTLALFVLGAPATLQLADTRTGQAEVVARDIGRSLHLIPGRGAVSFVQRVSDDEWWISELDVRTRATRRLIRTPPGSADHAWTPDGTLLAAQGSRLFAWRSGEEGWRRIADLEAAGIAGITRLAVAPRGDRLALVAERR